MRMWNVPVGLICRRHLMGEHVETHMMYGTLKLGKSIKGYLEKGLFDFRILQSRHDELAAEMLRRGYKHTSPMQVDKLLIKKPGSLYGRIDSDANLVELAHRCYNCYQMQNKAVDNCLTDC